MYNHNKAQQSKNREHISWDILYDNTAHDITGIILGVGSANERRHNIVIPPLIRWVYTPNDPCISWMFLLANSVYIFCFYFHLYIYCWKINIQKQIADKRHITMGFQTYKSKFFSRQTAVLKLKLWNPESTIDRCHSEKKYCMWTF